VNVNENVKIIFRAYFRQKWIDLRQTKTKKINNPLYVEYISLEKKLLFL